MTFPTVDTRYIETFKDHTQRSAPLSAKAHSESLHWFDADPGELPVFLARVEANYVSPSQSQEFISGSEYNLISEYQNWRWPFASDRIWPAVAQALPTLCIASGILAIPALIFAFAPADSTRNIRNTIETDRLHFAAHMPALAVASAFASEGARNEMPTDKRSTANETVVARQATSPELRVPPTLVRQSDRMTYADDVAVSLPAWGGDTFYSSMASVAQDGSSAIPVNITMASEPDVIVAAVESTQPLDLETNESLEFANPKLLQAAMEDVSASIEPTKKSRRARRKKAKAVPAPLTQEAATQEATTAPFFASVKLPPLFGGEAPKPKASPSPEPVIVTPQASSNTSWAPTSMNDIFLNFQ